MIIQCYQFSFMFMCKLWQNHNLKDILNGMYMTISLIYEDGINVSIKVLLDRNLQFTYVVGCLCEKQ